jgi:DNA-binding IclR family transcriptional regulator
MARRALSASRALDVLNFLAAHPGEAFSYSQLSQRLAVNLASTHSLLLALLESGYLTRCPSDRTFSLGPALVALGDAALRENPALDEARVQMRRLSRELGRETLALVRAGSDALCVARAGPAQQQRARTLRVGQRIPLMAPLASVFVAWAPEGEVERWLVRGGAAPRVQRRQREILRRVRERGFSAALEVPGRRQLGELLAELAEDPRDEALRNEMRAVIRELGRGSYQLGDDGAAPPEISTLTAPVFDRWGRVELALTIQVFEASLPARAIDAIGKRLLRAARAISRVGSAAPLPSSARAAHAVRAAKRSA